MEYREVKAKTIDEAKLIIKKEYGSNARIIKVSESAKGGFFGIGKKKEVSVLISVTDTDLLKKYKQNLGIIENEKKKNSFSNGNQAESLTLSLVMEKLSKIESEIKKNSTNTEEVLHPNLDEIKKILKQNDFYDEFINELLNEIKQKLPFNTINDRIEVHKFVYDYISSLLKISKNKSKEGEDKRIFILVGPTGVGKTTTIAKIAANAIKEKLKVELITIDGYRIGAKYQLEKYAEYMRTPVSGIEENLELQKVVDLSDANLILIDTIGRSSRDEMNLVKMKQLLKLNNRMPEYILAVSASTKPSEVKKIFKSFDIFEYRDVIITKIDESDTIGAVLNCCFNHNKAVKFFTNGQRVPNDIEKADKNNLLNKINGLETEVYLQGASF